MWLARQLVGVGWIRGETFGASGVIGWGAAGASAVDPLYNRTGISEAKSGFWNERHAELNHSRACCAATTPPGPPFASGEQWAGRPREWLGRHHHLQGGEQRAWKRREWLGRHHHPRCPLSKGRNRAQRDMSASWKDVRRARIPVEDLPVLAELRGRGEIRVLIAGEVAWISWKPESELMDDLLVRRILPLDEAVLYTERDGRWYRLGEHLPTFDVPGSDELEWTLLERTIFPEAIRAVMSREKLHAPIPIRVVRDAVSAPRAATGLRCSPSSLAAWAERSTSAQLAALKGAWLGVEALVLVTGSSGSLPLSPDGLRFWGTELFIPLGFRAEPDLPASAIRRAAGAKPDELAVLDEDGIELIPHAIFKPLSRAAIRMMREGDVTTREPSA
jgi:MoxR-vWA-beta-propeller ternary system domain bpX2/FtsH ternary system domain X7